MLNHRPLRAGHTTLAGSTMARPYSRPQVIHQVFMSQSGTTTEVLAPALRYPPISSTKQTWTQHPVCEAVVVPAVRRYADRVFEYASRSAYCGLALMRYVSCVYILSLHIPRQQNSLLSPARLRRSRRSRIDSSMSCSIGHVADLLLSHPPSVHRARLTDRLIDLWGSRSK